MTFLESMRDAHHGRRTAESIAYTPAVRGREIGSTGFRVVELPVTALEGWMRPVDFTLPCLARDTVLYMRPFLHLVVHGPAGAEAGTLEAQGFRLATSREFGEFHRQDAPTLRAAVAGLAAPAKPSRDAAGGSAPRARLGRRSQRSPGRDLG